MPSDSTVKILDTLIHYMYILHTVIPSAQLNHGCTPHKIYFLFLFSTLVDIIEAKKSWKFATATAFCFRMAAIWNLCEIDVKIMFWNEGPPSRGHISKTKPPSHTIFCVFAVYYKNDTIKVIGKQIFTVFSSITLHQQSHLF